MVALTWGRLVVAVLVLVGIGVLACWRFYSIGFDAGENYGERRGYASGARAQSEAYHDAANEAEAARLATIRENRRNGQLARHAKRKGEA